MFKEKEKEILHGESCVRDELGRDARAGSHLNRGMGLPSIHYEGSAAPGANSIGCVVDCGCM